MQHIDYLFKCITRIQPSSLGDRAAILKHVATHKGTHRQTRVQRMSHVTNICWWTGLYVLFEIWSGSTFTTQIF